MLVATNVLFLAEPVLLGKIVDSLRGGDPAGEIPTLALLMVVFAIATALTRIVSRIALFNAARSAEFDMRGDLFNHLLRLEPAFYRAHPTGDVMSRLTNDVQTVRAMWGPGILNIVNTAVAFVSVVTMMLLIDPMLTFWAILPYPIMFLAGRVFGRRIYKASRGVQEQLGSLSSTIQEDLTGIGIIKSYTLEDRRKGNFRRMSEVLLGRNMELTNVRGQLIPVLSGLASIGTVIVLWFGGIAVIEGRLGLGSLVEFQSYLARLVWPTLALGWMLSLFQRGMASWRRLEEVLLTEPAIVDGAGPDLTDIRGEVDIRDLTIEIDGKVLLDRVSVRFPAGSVTAIVGRTGSGKSTLIEALPRLIDVPAGAVFLDGRDITELPLGTLRHAIGYAPQEAFLFSTTIAGNIAYGYERDRTPLLADSPGGQTVRFAEPAGTADRALGGRADDSLGGAARRGPGDVPDGPLDQRLVSATAAAGLTRDLAALPSGYDTVVGERGITLSGGQRQRVALARALATLPRLLILDDSLSSVDAETEREILEHLTRVMKGRTAILISHRVAAVKRADQIVCMDSGRVVEIGTHDELLARGGVYAEVYQSQLEPDVAEVPDTGDAGDTGDAAAVGDAADDRDVDELDDEPAKGGRYS